MKYRSKNIINKGGKQLLVIAIVFLNIFCNNQDKNELSPGTIYQKDTIVGIVSNIQVRNAPGKAIIKFTPPDSGILFVKAVYKLSNGEQRSVISNLYEDSLVLDGFSDTHKHEVKVYSVNRSGVISSPQIVIVQPEPAPLNRVFNSLKVDNYFGGYRLTAENIFEDVVGIIVIQKSDTSDYTEEGDKSVYSSQDSIVSVVNDLDPEKTYQFGFYVIDQYGNTSDTMFKEINPIGTELPDVYVSAIMPWQSDNERIYIFRSDEKYTRFNTKTFSITYTGDDYPLSNDDTWPNLSQYDQDMTAILVIGKMAYLFLNDGTYVEYDEDSYSTTAPQPVNNQNWPGLEGYGNKISGAANWLNGYSYIFLEDGTYLKYDNSNAEIVSGPSLVNNQNWPGMEDYGKKIVAVYVNATNTQYAYFFLNDNTFIKYDIQGNKALDGYPKPVNNTTWPKVLNN